jgi:hypothetical protein
VSLYDSMELGRYYEMADDGVAGDPWFLFAQVGSVLCPTVKCLCF